MRALLRGSLALLAAGAALGLAAVIALFVIAEDQPDPWGD